MFVRADKWLGDHLVRDFKKRHVRLQNTNIYIDTIDVILSEWHDTGVELLINGLLREIQFILFAGGFDEPTSDGERRKERRSKCPDLSSWIMMNTNT